MPATMSIGMKSRSNRLDNAGARARAKQAARLVDARAVSSGRKSVGGLRRENELLAPLAGEARVNLRASRSLG